VGSELAEEKRRLRAALEARRRAIAPDEALVAGRSAAQRLVGDPRMTAKRVALYAALPREMPTRPLFEALAERGIPRLLPRTLREGGLVFAAAERWEDLVPGRLGILEPPEREDALSLGSEDLVVVPGVAFDASGRRLGQGGGHYDRTFPVASQPSGPRLIGFAFEIQLVDRVPHDSHDRGMDAIVTERRILVAARQRGMAEE